MGWWICWILEQENYFFLPNSLSFSENWRDVLLNAGWIEKRRATKSSGGEKKSDCTSNKCIAVSCFAIHSTTDIGTVILFLSDPVHWNSNFPVYFQSDLLVLCTHRHNMQDYSFANFNSSFCCLHVIWENEREQSERIAQRNAPVVSLWLMRWRSLFETELFLQHIWCYNH